MQHDFWMNKTGTRGRKCFIVSVISFLVYFDKQVKKKLGKNKQAKNIQTLNFAESNAHRRTNARDSFET